MGWLIAETRAGAEIVTDLVMTHATTKQSTDSADDMALGNTSH